MPVALAATYHDPEGRQTAQLERVLPALLDIFEGLAIYASHSAPAAALELWSRAGARIHHETPADAISVMQIGKARRTAIQLAASFQDSHTLFCDADRVLHWADYHPDELKQTTAQIADHDFTVLGRTDRAFASHPRVQRDTEAIINHVYSLVSSRPWDVTGAARGLSHRAITAILAGCPDENISTDVTWPLYIQQHTDLSLGYIATQGLEFETLDSFRAEANAMGGPDTWIAHIDADPRHWANRLELARIEVEAMISSGI